MRFGATISDSGIPSPTINFVKHSRAQAGSSQLEATATFVPAAVAVSQLNFRHGRLHWIDQLDSGQVWLTPRAVGLQAGHYVTDCPYRGQIDSMRRLVCVLQHAIRLNEATCCRRLLRTHQVALLACLVFEVAVRLGFEWRTASPQHIHLWIPDTAVQIKHHHLRTRTAVRRRIPTRSALHPPG
jgi:hypothetical protein